MRRLIIMMKRQMLMMERVSQLFKVVRILLLGIMIQMQMLMTPTVWYTVV